MTRYFATAILLCTASTGFAQESIQIQNTYHVEVEVTHWRIGSPSWVSQFTTNDHEQAEFMRELFEIALEAGALRDMLGYSWQWLILDVRIRTEYPPELSAPVSQSRLIPMLRRVRPPYRPAYPSAP